MKLVTFKSLMMRTSLLFSCFLFFSLAGYANKTRTAELGSGIYLGFNAGGNFNKNNFSAQQVGFNNLSGTHSSRVNFSSAYPGVEIGYLHFFASKWVAGILGDYSYNGRRNNNLNYNCSFDKAIQDRFTIYNTMQSSLLGRLGYALNNYLTPYITGGVSFARLKLAYNNEINDFYSIKNNQIGWRIGGGMEWRSAANWSFGAAYYYTEYNRFSMAMPVIYNLADINGNAKLKVSSNTVQASVKYWF